MSSFAAFDFRGTGGGRAEEILTAHGRSPFARIARLPNYRRTVVNGTSVVAWVKRGPLALVLAEPVGPEEAVQTTIATFTAECRHAGLYPVWVPVSADRMGPFESAGYRHIGIGHTARVDLCGFSVSGRRARSLRNGINRARRAGLWTEIWHPETEGWEPIREVSEAWLRTKRLDERRFGMGWFDPAYLKGQEIAVARSRFGRVEAFATWMETGEGTQGALDLIRYRPDAPPGVMDFLVADIARRLRIQGKEALDLGLAPLAGASGGFLEGILGFVYRHGRPFYDFQGLYRFKNKWSPRWAPMALAYPPPWRTPPLLEGLARMASQTLPDPRMGGAQFGGFARIPGQRKG